GVGAGRDVVEQGAVTEDGSDGFLRHLLEVVAGHLTGDDDLRVVGNDHQAAQLPQRTAGQRGSGFGRKDGTGVHRVAPSGMTSDDAPNSWAKMGDNKCVDRLGSHCWNTAPTIGGWRDRVASPSRLPSVG